MRLCLFLPPWEAGLEEMAGSRMPLKSVGFVKMKGLRHPSFALTTIHWTWILCSIKSNLPRGKPDSFMPSLCSESGSHMAYFNKSPLLPTASDLEANPKGSGDGPFSRLSNQPREHADWLRSAPQNRGSSLPCGLGSILGLGKQAQHQASPIKSLSVGTWKGQEEGVKTDTGAGVGGWEVQSYTGLT